MPTEIRIQPLRSSLGQIAAEHARIEAAIEEKRKEMAHMTATPTPSGDDLVRALANEIAAEEARTAEKREALRRAEVALQTQRRDSEAERARAAAEARQALVAELNGATEAYLDATDKAEQHLVAFVSAANEALKAHGDVCRSAKALTVGAKLPMGLDVNDMVRRLGDRIAGTLRRIRVPGTLTTTRIGSLNIPAASPTPATEWRQREEAALSHAVDQVIAHKGH
jgi:hypothetical protein